MDVPLACTLDISDNNLERAELKCGNCIERNIQKNESPLKEGVGRIR